MWPSISIQLIKILDMKNNVPDLTNRNDCGFVPITSQIPYWLYEKIEKEASKRNLSKSAYVRGILLRIFEENLKSSELNEKSKVV